MSIFIGKIILLLFIVGCGSPEGRDLKYSPQKQKGSKSISHISQDNRHYIYQSNEQLSDKECAANMAQLLILIQEFKEVGGVVSVGSGVWCPTHAQLQAIRNGIKTQKGHIKIQKAQRLQAKIDQSKREDDEEEARIRAQANR